MGRNERCIGYTGADLAALVREAGIQALKEHMLESDRKSKIVVSERHFNKAFNKLRPSVTEKVRELVLLLHVPSNQ